MIDAWDRRRLLIVAQLGAMSAVAILLVSSMLADPPIPLIFLGLAVAAAFSALDSPTRSAMTPRLLGAELIPSAQALNQVVWNGAALAGPRGGRRGDRRRRAHGRVRDRPGLAPGDARRRVDRSRRCRPSGPSRTRPVRRAIKEGFAYVRDNPLIRSTFVIDLVAMIFGMPRALFTFLIVDDFHRSEELVGLLFSAPAVGAFLGAITSGWTRRVRAQGRAVIVAVAVCGASRSRRSGWPRPTCGSRSWPSRPPAGPT